MKLPQIRPFVWKKDRLLLLDQRRLPNEVRWVTCRRWQDVSKGIREMVVRGAPAIGCVAAYGIALAARQRALEAAEKGLLAARPTAVNLRWSLERTGKIWRNLGAEKAVHALEAEAARIEEEDRQANIRIGQNGAELLPAKAVVMTICNTGSLATAGLGTALGVIWTARQAGKISKVIVLETRPYLQGARLTAWELKAEKIPFELITDNMAGHLMKTERIDAVCVGADRIAANGDTANKVGTYGLAVLAKHHGIPFYVAAPHSTLDLRASTGREIPIEERSPKEVLEIGGKPIAPRGSKARHPAFDVTPAELITAIITDAGVARPPFEESLRAVSI